MIFGTDLMNLHATEVIPALVAVVLLIGMIAMYFLPWLVARSRQHHNRTAIGVMNLLLGWTFLGWIAALVWAFAKPASQASS